MPARTGRTEFGEWIFLNYRVLGVFEKKFKTYNDQYFLFMIKCNAILGLVLILISFTLVGQESVPAAVQAGRKVYYGIHGGNPTFQATCAPGTTYSVSEHGTVIKTESESQTTNYYFDPSSLLRFIYIDRGGLVYRYYYALMELDDLQIPVLCRYIDADGSTLEKEQIEVDDLSLRKTAYDLKNKLELACSAVTLVNSYSAKKEERLNAKYTDGFETMSIDHLAEERAADLAEGEERGATAYCWDTETYTIRSSSQDTVKIVRASGCDPGCMMYQESHDYSYRDGSPQIDIHSITSYLMGLGHSLENSYFPLHITTVHETTEYHERDRLVLRTVKVLVNDVPMSFVTNQIK